jgi:AraC-like DNA-binding protein
MDPSVVRRLWRARDFMYSEFPSPLSLSSVAAEANYSPFHFHRLYRSVFGETPTEYLIRRRMEEAARMIVETDATILEVVLAIGYESQQTFSERFRRFTGLSPSEYRLRYRNPIWHIDLRHLMVPACFIRRRA